MFTLRYFRKNWKFMLSSLICIIVFLSIIIVGIVAIAKNWPQKDTTADDGRPNIVGSDVVATDGTEPTETPATETVPVTEPVLIDVDLPDGYEHVTEEVRILSQVNLRSRPSGNKNDIIAIIPMYDIATRVGVGENGWSAIITADGVLGYLASYYLEPTRDPTYTEVDEVVYATKDANIRNGHSIIYDTIGEMSKDDAFVRTAVGDNGWSKIVYNGEEAYAYSLYLTTEVPSSALVDNATYKEVNETVYTTTRVNVRTGPGSNHIAIGRLAPSSTITRIGVGDNGWSKILYEGKECYMVSKYLKVKAQ